MMTSASQVTNKGNPIKGTPFDFGAGHVNPAGMLDPGLVYDAGELDWQRYTCSAVTSRASRPNYCKKACRGNKCNGVKGLRNVNLPSFSFARLSPGSTAKAKRTVTYVGSAPSAGFSWNLQLPTGYTGSLDITRAGTKSNQKSTAALNFGAPGDARTFTLKIKTSRSAPQGWSFGSLTFTSGKWAVRTPIALQRP
jgi:hypothetical protein